MERNDQLLLVSKRLIILTGLFLLVTTISFGLTLFLTNRFMVSWFCFFCGIIGGFVSIEQRLKKLGSDELDFLSKSWWSILVIPLFGGVFSLVLYLLFLSGLLEGSLFPSFHVPAFADPPVDENLKSFFAKTYPRSPADFAKLAFWSFVAGFSERFVPRIVKKLSDEGGRR